VLCILLSCEGSGLSVVQYPIQGILHLKGFTVECHTYALLGTDEKWSTLSIKALYLINLSFFLFLFLFPANVPGQK
jgi:hypothetical protein